jgi:hypothetical protein
MLSIDQIVELVKVDFEERAIVARVEFGGWKKDLYTKAPLVLFDLDTYSSDEGGPANYPGPAFTNEDETEAARTLTTRVQRVRVHVYGAPPGKREPNRSVTAHSNAAALLHKTIAALHRIAHGSFGWGDGEWPSDDTQDFAYGSYTRFVAEISIPVLDDAHVVVMPTAAVMQVVSVDGAGDEEVIVDEGA